jgi:hypothetical protein
VAPDRCRHVLSDEVNVCVSQHVLNRPVDRVESFLCCSGQYELRLAASDNLKENYTTVVIHVKDVNDNPPVFERPTYRTQITEEDDRNLPKRVLQVVSSPGA